MRSISLYARHHYLQARIFIAVAHCLLVTGAFYVGNNLHDLGVSLPRSVIILSVAAMAVAIVFLTKKPKNYLRQRVVYFVIAAAGFAGSCSVFNHPFPPAVAWQVNGSVAIKLSEQETPKSQRHQLRNLIRTLRAESKKAGGNGGKVVGTILVIVGAIALLMLLAAASCSLACAGSEVLAAIVGIAGTVGIVMLTVWAIRKINRKKTAEPAAATET